MASTSDTADSSQPDEANQATRIPDQLTGSFSRDPYVDVLRAFSLTVVVIWHWVFTILVWEPTGPFPSSPLAFTHGLWPLTWIGQVMPLFFFVGGFAHLNAWEKVRQAGGGYSVFVGGRFRRLAIPVFPLLAVWAVLYLAIRLIAAPPWLLTSIVLVVSPLWFLAV